MIRVGATIDHHDDQFIGGRIVGYLPEIIRMAGMRHYQMMRASAAANARFDARPAVWSRICSVLENAVQQHN